MLNGKSLLVAGATGYLGGYAAREFKSRGFWVRTLARSPEKLGGLLKEVDEAVTGQVTDSTSIRGCCDCVDIVFSSIGITHQKDGLTYMDVDHQGNVNLLREAQRVGVSRFIYVSVFNADIMGHLQVVRAKLLFEKELKASGLDYTIIRPNGFFSDMVDFLRMAQRGRGYVFGSGEYRINPIHGRDLAAVCADAALSSTHEIDVGGPEVFTHNEILALAFDACSKPVKIRQIPIWLRNIALTGAKKLMPARLSGPLEFFMTVMAMDMVAPKTGKCRLARFFSEELSTC